MFSFKTSCSLTNGSSTQYNLSDFFINIFGRVLMKLNSLNINKYFSSDFSRKIMIFQLGWLAEENLCIFKNLNQFCRVLSQMECLFVSWLELATLLPNDDIICFNLNFLNIYNVFFFVFLYVARMVSNYIISMDSSEQPKKPANRIDYSTVW